MNYLFEYVLVVYSWKFSKNIGIIFFGGMGGSGGLSQLAITLDIRVGNHHSLQSHKTSATPPLCIKVSAPSEESER